MKMFVTEYRQKLKKVEQVEIAGHGQNEWNMVLYRR